MILLHHDKEYLKYCKQVITEFVETQLNLSLNKKTQISKLNNGIDFLGFRSILLKSGKVIRLLRGQAKVKMKHKLKLLGKLKQNNIVDEEFINKRLTAYKGYLCHANCYKLFKTYSKKNGL